MKKALICLLLALVLVAVLEPHVRGKIQSEIEAAFSSLPSRQDENGDQEREERQDEALDFSRQLGGGSRTDMMEVTLYFRFADTDVLGTQRAQLDIRREETVATSIVQRLVEGPDMAHEHLVGVFPQGTRVISVTDEGTTAFVTLSNAFLGKPDGAPKDWEDLPQWQEEAALRRRLAVQSVTLALTENGRFQRVQFYVADGDDEIPQRIPMAYMNPDETDLTLLLAACSRDEQALLTPGRTLERIMDAWQKQDWAALYVLLTDAQDEPLPTLTVFETQMAEWGISLLDYSVSQGTVSLDGQTATLVLDAEIRSREGGDAQLVRESVPLQRVQDNWAMEPGTLRALMIRD